MDNRIKAAFDLVHAEDSLKTSTKAFIYEKTHSAGRHNAVRVRRFAAAAVCFLAVLLSIGGYACFFTPVAAISMDINPSLELKLNMFDKVIAITGYNDDGIRLADSLNIRYMDYTDALNAILENETITACLKKGEQLAITVTGISAGKSERIGACISEHANVTTGHVHCSDNWEYVDAANAAGLSVGKYQAFLALKEIYPDITVEDVRALTMQQIYDMLGQEFPYSGSGGCGNNDAHTGNGQGQQGQGQGHGHGSGHG